MGSHIHGVENLAGQVTVDAFGQIANTVTAAVHVLPVCELVCIFATDKSELLEHVEFCVDADAGYVKLARADQHVVRMILFVDGHGNDTWRGGHLLHRIQI